MKTVSFVVHAIPPYKQSPADAIEKRHQTQRVKACQDGAKEGFANQDIIDDPCSVSIRYSRAKGKSDGANIIGGVLDSLQGIAFENDNQVIEISYAEFKGAEDWYQVTITEVMR